MEIIKEEQRKGKTNIQQTGHFKRVGMVRN